MRKLLLVLQWWEGDRLQAERLARLLADIEPLHSKTADILLVCRRDSKIDPQLVKYVSAKFDTWTLVCRRQAKGYPFAPNEMVCDLAAFVHERLVAKLMPDYKAMMLMEGDAAPLVKDWILRLHSAFDEAKANVVGHYIPQPWHINGNCMLSCDLGFLGSFVRVGGCSPTLAWDLAFAKFFHSHGWKDHDAIRSWWNHKTFIQEEYDQLLSSDCAYFHGCKDNTLHEVVRRNLLPIPEYVNVSV